VVLEKPTSLVVGSGPRRSLLAALAAARAPGAHARRWIDREPACFRAGQHYAGGCRGVWPWSSPRADGRLRRASASSSSKRAKKAHGPPRCTEPQSLEVMRSMRRCFKLGRRYLSCRKAGASPRCLHRLLCGTDSGQTASFQGVITGEQGGRREAILAKRVIDGDRRWRNIAARKWRLPYPQVTQKRDELAVLRHVLP